MHRIIHLHAAAPVKPPEHQPCNGCGVCCAMAPCPLGAIVSGRFRGRCSALLWTDAQNLYRCGLVARPADHLPTLLRFAAPMLAGLARRSISAGSGCDCSASTDQGVLDA